MAKAVEWESGGLVLLPGQPLTGWITFGKVTQAQLYNEKVELNDLKGPLQPLQSVILITACVVFHLRTCWRFIDCRKPSFLVVLMTQDSCLHEAVNCEYLKREVVTYPLTHQGKAYMLVKCVNLLVTISPTWALAWLHCSSYQNPFPWPGEWAAQPWAAT